MALHPELRREWKDSGYTTTMGSAAVVRPPDRAFLRTYHVTKAEHAVAAVALGRLKVARFSDLNDPFELMAADLNERGAREAVRTFKSKYDGKRGMLCFSADWTNPVLWSHYGERHRGIALGFDVRRSMVRAVAYDDERLLAAIDSETKPVKLSRELRGRLLCTKYRHWQYEEEVRMFVRLADAVKEGRLHFRMFDDDLRLTEVILGPECRLPLTRVRRAVRACCPGAVVFKARLAFKKFKVVPDEATVL